MIKVYYIQEKVHYQIKDMLINHLYFYLKLLDLSSRDSGSTLPSMTFDAYYELEVEIPRIKKQKKILDLLNPIEEKIMINNKINDNLDYLNYSDIVA